MLFANCAVSADNGRLVLILLLSDLGCTCGSTVMKSQLCILNGVIIGTIPNKKNAFWGPFFAHIFRHYQGKIKAI